MGCPAVGPSIESFGSLFVLLLLISSQNQGLHVSYILPTLSLGAIHSDLTRVANVWAINLGGTVINPTRYEH